MIETTSLSLQSARGRLNTGRTAKGSQTRDRILESALLLFRDQGYEQTTMRAVARDAGVALGNTYYYFESKEHLLLAFYERLHQEHLSAALPLLDSERDLKKRVRGVIAAKIDASEPYHRFSQLLFKTAGDPRSPLNPFSRESAVARRQSIGLFESVVAGSTKRIPEDLRGELPYLLWLYHMGIVLYWIHDESEGRAKTYRLIDTTVDLVIRIVTLSGLPGLGALRRRAVALIKDLRPA